MLGIDEHRFRSVRFFRDPATKAWTRYEPWMTTIVDLDTGQVLGVVDGRDHKGVGDWLFARPLEWRLGVQVVAIDPSAAFRKALRMWLPRTAVSVDHFHLVTLGEPGHDRGPAEPVPAGQGPPRPRRSTRPGRTGCCSCAPATPSRNAAAPAGGSVRRRRPDRQARSRLEGQGTAPDPAAHRLPRRRRRRERTTSRAWSRQPRRPETNRLYRTVCRWWKEIEVLIVTGATTGKVEANNTANQTHQTHRARLPQPRQLQIALSS